MGSKSYDLAWGLALRITTQVHRFVHKVSGGRLGRRFPGGAHVVWITTLGRKSGQWRKNPLLAVPIDGGWGIAGSNAGQEKIPGWIFNVQSHDQGFMEIDGDEFPAVFTQVTGDTRERIYRGLTEKWSSYDLYQRNIKREIPVFLVTRADSAD